MVVNIAPKREYIPEWNGNKDEKVPFVVVHRAPTMSLYDELVPKPKVTMKIGKEGAEGGETEISIDTTAIVKRMLLEIKGLSLHEEGKDDIPIISAKDLFGENAPSVLSGLTDELGRYFQNLLTEKVVDTKN
jgi:hypothetical protein